VLDENELQDAIAKLRAAAGSDEFEIDLDVHPYNTGPNLGVLAQLDATRDEAIKRGERLAYFYTREWTMKHAGWRLWIRASVVTHEQAKRLPDAMIASDLSSGRVRRVRWARASRHVFHPRLYHRGSPGPAARRLIEAITSR
jgi:hypothetical protein